VVFAADKITFFQLMEAPERWALFDHLPGASTYAKNNFCLLGDAAHATTPHCGAGAGFAIEDAHLLSGLLTPDLIQSVDDVQHAFRAYDEMRRPRCEELVKKSRANGMLFDLQDGGDVTEDELWGDLEKKMQWVWNVDLVGMLENGRALLRKYKNAG
jgi:salicylate hydroxylase